mmetsp:Transcript_27010/g.37584  ORF Transcript_27010/g.37584 Transcript_27010/m.37584 type:complete len:284 (+) Transcript_27010:80-931(+)|eukprot:CAMPEP_0184500528 /NCGR_PEP_ID=MMETSP0113_2-20130426/45081_1 /TAXON_ID=91329 /ORGANISM="Norrisiella sphaerica, Strain BC52" /LENGTH=283 /DNA_ID=CAMNT_0026888941 /DNA_START=75 /DNA_END=926 /DNA_ORIENTATION=+
MSEEVGVKLVVVGGPKSGKTALVHRFKKRNFQAEYIPTVGFNVNTFQLTKAIQKQTLDICLQIWDVSHMEIGGLHLETIFEDASGVMMVLDPTNPQSLLHLDQWHKIIRAHVRANIHLPVSLVLTKFDVCKEHTSSTASLIASSLALSTHSSFAKLFSSGTDEKAGISQDKGGQADPHSVPSLDSLRPQELKSVVDRYCQLAGIREWKQCSSKSGKNVKDALYSLVNMSLQPVLQERLKEIGLQRAPKQQTPIFGQSFDDIPPYMQNKASGQGTGSEKLESKS